MEETNTITIRANRKNVIIDIGTIIYVLMKRKDAEIHVLSGEVYVTRMTCGELVKKLGPDFLEVRRGCIVSIMAIYRITDIAELSNGEQLNISPRRRKEIVAELHKKQKEIIGNFTDIGTPENDDEYRKHYSCFDNMPFAFTDIEIVFNEEKQAVDWIFRYGNQALAKLEKKPLNDLIGHSFGSIFANMDEKWLRCYQRSALFGETLQIIDYSPEIDSYLNITSFPTFKGHCGCILFDIGDIKYISGSSDAAKALKMYFGAISEETDRNLSDNISR